MEASDHISLLFRPYAFEYVSLPEGVLYEVGRDDRRGSYSLSVKHGIIIQCISPANNES